MTTMPTWPWRRNPVRFHSQPIVPGVPLLLELTLKGRADIRETERADGRATDRVGRSVENSIEHRLLLVTVTSTHLHDFSSWIKLVLVCKWYIYTISNLKAHFWLAKNLLISTSVQFETHQARYVLDLVKVKRVVPRNRAIKSRLSKNTFFRISMVILSLNDGDGDGDGDEDDDDDFQMKTSCLEEGGPLGVKTTGSPNIGFANPSNLLFIMTMILLMLVTVMSVKMATVMISYPRKDRFAAVHIFNSALPDQTLWSLFLFDLITWRRSRQSVDPQRIRRSLGCWGRLSQTEDFEEDRGRWLGPHPANHQDGHYDQKWSEWLISSI